MKQFMHIYSDNIQWYDGLSADPDTSGDPVEQSIFLSEMNHCMKYKAGNLQLASIVWEIYPDTCDVEEEPWPTFILSI